MPGFTHGIPGPVSLFASSLIRRVNMNRLSLKQDEELLKKFTPVFVLISSKHDNRRDWLKAGQLYEHIALEAVKNDLQTSPLAAPIQKDSFNQALQSLLAIHYRPQVFFRLGYCKENLHATPRLSFQDVIHS